VGAGLESIDCDYANTKMFNCGTEGNKNAVAEHTLGMILF
jgi:phosphoglycerate dehydrogenase-like enzyme